MTSAYQAEYGRSTGIQISGVTKSGTNQFRGSIYDIERQGSWNANTWVNSANGNPKPMLKESDWGYTIGGPVGKPGGSNKFFFFYSEQFSPRTSGGAVNRFRVPSLLERQGDFSQTTDNTGARFNLIRDAATNLPCTAADTRGCFQDGGVLGRIPQNRLYDLGVNILKTYPEPNTQGLNFNLETVAPNVDRNTYQHVVRVDYQASQKLRITAKYAGQNATVQTNPGTIPGFNDTVFQFPAILVPSATVTYTLNSSTVLEGTYGLTQGNQLGNVPMNPVTNRNAVGLGNFPLLYPNNGAVPAGSYQEKVLERCRRPITSTAASRWRRATCGAAASAADPESHAAQQRVSAISLHAEHPRRGHRADEALGIAHVQGRIPVAGQHEAAEPRDCDLWRAAVRRQSEFR